MKGPIPILIPALVALSICAALALIAFLAGRSRPVFSPELQRVVFRYRLLLRSSAVFASVFLPVAITFLLLLITWDRVEPLYVGGVFLLVGMICSPLLWEFAWYFIAVDATGIKHRSAWRGIRAFRWDEISEVTYSVFNMWFIIQCENTAKIRVPILVGNLKEFLLRIEQHLPLDALRHARKGYETVGRPFPALVNDPILEARPPR